MRKLRVAGDPLSYSSRGVLMFLVRERSSSLPLYIQSSQVFAPLPSLG